MADIDNVRQSKSQSEAHRQRSSRESFIRTTGKLLRRQGYAATGLNEIVTRSGAPRGSLYFHFPGGKEELAVAAMHSTGEQLRAAIAAILHGEGELCDSLGRLLDLLAAGLEGSGFEDGCPIATVTLEAAGSSPALRAVSAGVFESWIEEIEQRLVLGGAQIEDARRRALLILSAIEGALILARAARDPTPLQAVREELCALLR